MSRSGQSLNRSSLGRIDDQRHRSDDRVYSTGTPIAAATGKYRQLNGIEDTLDADLKTRWIAALRSGEYQQGQGVLRQEDRFCCMGVLELIIGVKSTDRCFLAGHVAEIAGLPYYTDAKVQGQLAQMNDGFAGIGSHAPVVRHTFSQIADWIEANL